MQRTCAAPVFVIPTDAPYSPSTHECGRGAGRRWLRMSQRRKAGVVESAEL